MRLLAVETATDLVGTAVAVDATATAACWSLGRRRHAESLAPMVHDVCRHSGVELSELDAIAVDVGPGLFTGLRVGLAMANALGTSLGIGVLGVGSLELLAEGAAEGAGAASWPRWSTPAGARCSWRDSPCLATARCAGSGSRAGAAPTTCRRC